MQYHACSVMYAVSYMQKHARSIMHAYHALQCMLTMHSVTCIVYYAFGTMHDSPCRWFANGLFSVPGDLPHGVSCVQGKCDGPPPNSFTLTEPMPPGACAVQVREDFLDAPSGTTCLLIDSLYVLVAPRGGVDTSSVLILHVRPP